MSGSREFGQCVEWCPMCHAESERLGGQGPADGAPSPENVFDDFDFRAGYRACVVEIERLEAANEASVSSLRAVERERDQLRNAVDYALRYEAHIEHEPACETGRSRSFACDCIREKIVSRLHAARALSPGAATDRASPILNPETP